MKTRRIVLDTNVLISAIVFGGKPRQVLQAAISRDCKLVMSQPLLDELQGVLEGPKFQYPPEAMRAILHELASIAELVVSDRHINCITADPDDNRVLECAVAGKADFIISGDPHLLDLEEFEGISIQSPAWFVQGRKDKNRKEN